MVVISLENISPVLPSRFYVAAKVFLISIILELKKKQLSANRFSKIFKNEPAYYSMVQIKTGIISE